MALSGIALGIVKVALKRSAKKLIAEAVAQGGIESVSAGLQTFLKSNISDTEALILNRLKSAPNKALYQFASNELNLPVKEVRQIVKTFNQTPKMKELATGKGFSEAVRRKASKELNIPYQAKIKDIIKVIEKYNKSKSDFRYGQPEKETVSDTRIRSLLIEIEQELEVMLTGFTPDGKVVDIKTGIINLFVPGRRYTEDNVTILETIARNMSLDIEQYTQNEGGEVFIIENDGKWMVYRKTDILRYVNAVRDDVKMALKEYN